MKQVNSEKLRLNWQLLLLVYLLIATLISSGISFAKYTTSTDGSSAARVAAFKVTTTLQGATQSLDTTNAAGSYTHSFTVTNSSEVAVNSQLELSNIPSGVTVTCMVGSQDKGTVSNGTPVAIGFLAPGATSELIALTFTVDKSTSLDATNIAITVNAVQID